MAAKLIVRKETGEMLFDTTKISYGLVKSGPMFYVERWMRYIKRFTNTNPDDGASWQPGGVGDNIHGFTVVNPVCPIIFLVGPGTLTGTSVSGNTMTFLYTNASTNTKCYCFDLMSDNIPGGPYLKTWTPEGKITFNSLQIPLNVIATSTPPGPSAPFPDGWGGNYNCYNGGYNVVTGDSAPPQAAGVYCGIDIAMPDADEYAACLPWSRAVRCRYVFSRGGPTYFGCSEGAYGGAGKISFIMGPSGATQNGTFTFGAGYTAGARWDNIPTDRYPTAMIIKTKSYPYPYG